MRLKGFCALLLALLLLVGCNAAPEHTHEFSQEHLKLTCTQDSGLRYTCRCGYSYMDVDTKAAGHQYETTQVEAKGDLPAYTQHTCTVCGDTYQENFVGGNLDASEPDPTTEPGTTGTEPKPTEPKPTEPKPTEPKPTEGNANDSGQVMHFFDDAAFIGDSVSLKLQRYQAATGVFGSATFLTAGSYSVNHAVNDTMFLSYRGQTMTPEDARAACGAKKVFILLGMNDIGLVGVDGSIANWETFIGRIRAKNPDIAIYIQSGTPIYNGGERGSLTNANMNRYNEKLKTFAAQNNCYFIDIATTMKDGNGGLKAAYCSDQYVHLTDAACVAWVAVLRSFVGG